MRRQLVLGMIVNIIMLSGCATLFGGGSHQAIKIDSNTQTEIEIGHINDRGKIIDKQIIRVPAIINVNRENKDILIKTKNGKKIKLKKKINPWFWGDVIATSPLSTTVDAVTGALWKYDSNITIDYQK